VHVSSCSHELRRRRERKQPVTWCRSRSSCNGAVGHSLAVTCCNRQIVGDTLYWNTDGGMT
jgi:hypothetical protein